MLPLPGRNGLRHGLCSVGVGGTPEPEAQAKIGRLWEQAGWQFTREVPAPEGQLLEGNPTRILTLPSPERVARQRPCIVSQGLLIVENLSENPLAVNLSQHRLTHST